MGNDHPRHDQRVARQKQRKSDGKQQRSAGVLFAVLDPAVDQVQDQLGHGQTGNEAVKGQHIQREHDPRKSKVKADSDHQTVFVQSQIDRVDHLHHTEDEKADHIGAEGRNKIDEPQL